MDKMSRTEKYRDLLEDTDKTGELSVADQQKDLKEKSTVFGGLRSRAAGNSSSSGVNNQTRLSTEYDRMLKEQEEFLRSLNEQFDNIGFESDEESEVPVEASPYQAMEAETEEETVIMEDGPAEPVSDEEGQQIISDEPEILPQDFDIPDFHFDDQVTDNGTSGQTGSLETVAGQQEEVPAKPPVPEIILEEPVIEENSEIILEEPVFEEEISESVSEEDLSVLHEEIQQVSEFEDQDVDELVDNMYQTIQMPVLDQEIDALEEVLEDTARIIVPVHEFTDEDTVETIIISDEEEENYLRSLDEEVPHQDTEPAEEENEVIQTAETVDELEDLSEISADEEDEPAEASRIAYETIDSLAENIMSTGEYDYTEILAEIPMEKSLDDSERLEKALDTGSVDLPWLKKDTLLKAEEEPVEEVEEDDEDQMPKMSSVFGPTEGISIEGYINDPYDIDGAFGFHHKRHNSGSDETEPEMFDYSQPTEGEFDDDIHEEVEDLFEPVSMDDVSERIPADEAVKVNEQFAETLVSIDDEYKIALDEVNDQAMSREMRDYSAFQKASDPLESLDVISSWQPEAVENTEAEDLVSETIEVELEPEEEIAAVIEEAVKQMNVNEETNYEVPQQGDEVSEAVEDPDTPEILDAEDVLNDFDDIYVDVPEFDFSEDENNDVDVSAADIDSDILNEAQDLYQTVELPIVEETFEPVEETIAMPIIEEASQEEVDEDIPEEMPQQPEEEPAQEIPSHEDDAFEEVFLDEFQDSADEIIYDEIPELTIDLPELEMEVSDDKVIEPVEETVETFGEDLSVPESKPAYEPVNVSPFGVTYREAREEEPVKSDYQPEETDGNVRVFGPGAVDSSDNQEIDKEIDEMSDVFMDDDNVTSDIDQIIKDVKAYNIERGIRHDEDTQVNIITALRKDFFFSLDDDDDEEEEAVPVKKEEKKEEKKPLFSTMFFDEPEDEEPEEEEEVILPEEEPVQETEYKEEEDLILPEEEDEFILTEEEPEPAEPYQKETVEPRPFGTDFTFTEEEDDDDMEEMTYLEEEPVYKPEEAAPAYYENSEQLEKLSAQLEKERAAREEIYEQTQQLKLQFSEYENELSDMTDKLNTANRISDIIMVLLVIALFVILVIGAYYFASNRGLI